MRALLKPRFQSPHADEMIVEMVGRHVGGRIKVRSLNRGSNYFAVDRYRLYAEGDRNRRISEAEFNALPWLSATAPDPAKASVGDLLDHAARA